MCVIMTGCKLIGPAQLVEIVPVLGVWFLLSYLFVAGRLMLSSEEAIGVMRGREDIGRKCRVYPWGGEAWVREILTREGAKSEDP